MQDKKTPRIKRYRLRGRKKRIEEVDIRKEIILLVLMHHPDGIGSDMIKKEMIKSPFNIAGEMVDIYLIELSAKGLLTKEIRRRGKAKLPNLWRLADSFSFDKFWEGLTRKDKIRIHGSKYLDEYFKDSITYLELISESAIDMIKTGSPLEIPVSERDIVELYNCWKFALDAMRVSPSSFLIGFDYFKIIDRQIVSGKRNQASKKKYIEILPKWLNLFNIAMIQSLFVPLLYDIEILGREDVKKKIIDFLSDGNYQFIIVAVNEEIEKKFMDLFSNLPPLNK
jgi:hypothetical protein